MEPSLPAKKIPPSDPRHPEYKSYLAWLRGLSMKERGDLIIAKGQEAAREAQARKAAGLPPEPEEPYPPSTCEWLRRWAADARKRSEQQKHVESSSPCGTENANESR